MDKQDTYYIGEVTGSTGPGFLMSDHATMEVGISEGKVTEAPVWVMGWNKAEEELREVELAEEEETLTRVASIRGHTAYDKVKTLVGKWSKLRHSPSKAKRW